jgi:hypothetical protein
VPAPDPADPMDAALQYLPPASADQGNAGHDTAREASKAIRALTLRIGGASYAHIAADLRMSDPSSARHLVMRALARREAERVDELRAIENARLDADEAELRLIIGTRTKSDSARIRAVDARTRLSARRSRMNGLDAPVKVEVSASIQQELQAALEEYLSAARGAETVAGEVTGVHDER